MLKNVSLQFKFLHSSPSLRSGLFVLSHSKRKNHCIIERDIIQRNPLNEVPAETAWDVQAGSSVFSSFLHN